MKLRIKGNSIRMRLLKSEVERLSAAGTISEEVRFGIRTGQVLRYAIAVSDGVDELEAEFSDSQILVLMPESMALNWFAGDHLGVERVLKIDEETQLSILIEKDLECVDRPDDPDRADAYSNPKTNC